MSTTDLRCKHCNTLLAKQDRDGLSIRRGALQATITGANTTVAVTCYRCSTLNVMRIAATPTRAA